MSRTGAGPRKASVEMIPAYNRLYSPLQIWVGDGGFRGKIFSANTERSPNAMYIVNLRMWTGS